MDETCASDEKTVLWDPEENLRDEEYIKKKKKKQNPTTTYPYVKRVETTLV